MSKKPSNLVDGVADDIGMGVDEIKQWMRDYKVHHVRDEFVGRVVTIVIAGVGLVAALAWNDVLKDLFHIIFGEQATFNEKLVYALVITFIATIISVIVGKRFLKNK